MASSYKDEGKSRLRKAVDQGSRRSGVSAVVFLGVAMAAAVTAAFLFLRYVERRVDDSKLKIAKVAVAKIDLPLGTELTEEMLELADWPAQASLAGTFSTTQPLQGRTVLLTVFKGEPVLSQKLASKEAGSGLAALLPSGMLAVAVRVDDVVGVAGFIYPGNSVDVIVTMRPRESSSQSVSKIVLQKIKVLAVGKTLAQTDEKSKPIPATVATLMVTHEDAEKLAFATSQGKLLLALRSSVDQAETKTDGVSAGVLFADVESPAPPPPKVMQRLAPKPTPPPPIPAPQRQADVVEIMRGDQREQRTFGQ